MRPSMVCKRSMRCNLVSTHCLKKLKSCFYSNIGIRLCDICYPYLLHIRSGPCSRWTTIKSLAVEILCSNTLKTHHGYSSEKIYPTLKISKIPCGLVIRLIGWVKEIRLKIEASDMKHNNGVTNENLRRQDVLTFYEIYWP